MLDIDEILQNGKFNATYKLALLIAICHICELHPISQQSETMISYEELAEIFIDLYWQVSKPFPTVAGDCIALRQGINSGQDKAIELLQTYQAITKCQNFQQIEPKSPHYIELVAEMAKLIKNNPAKFLQSNLQQARFYSYDPSNDGIKLHKQVGYFFWQNAATIKHKASARWFDVMIHNPKNKLAKEDYPKLATVLGLSKAV